MIEDMKCSWLKYLDKWSKYCHIKHTEKFQKSSILRDKWPNKNGSEDKDRENSNYNSGMNSEKDMSNIDLNILCKFFGDDQKNIHFNITPDTAQC